jgi:hypothetical protein
LGQPVSSGGDDNSNYYLLPRSSIVLEAHMPTL